MPWNKNLMFRVASGTISALLMSGGGLTSAASSFEVLYRFPAGFDEPSSGLVHTPDGALYGTTMVARRDAVATVYRFLNGRLTITTGPPSGAPFGGTLFQVSQSGAFAVVHRFSTATPANNLLQVSCMEQPAVAARTRLERSSESAQKEK